MKRFISLLAVIVLLVVSTGAISADKPQPETFTITGYTTLLKMNPEPPVGHIQYHILAQGGGADDEANAPICAYLGTTLEPPVIVTTCDELCVSVTGQACGVSVHSPSGRYPEGKFTFDEWVDLDLSSLEATNSGVVTITVPAASNSGSNAVVQFDGEVDQVGMTVSGNFKVDEQGGKGRLKDLNGYGHYTGDAGLVFSVTFTFEPKD